MNNSGNNKQTTIDKLKKEFINIFPKKPSFTVENIVTLSAEEIEVEGENRERIIEALQLVRKNKLHRLIYCGVKIQNANLQLFLNTSNPNIQLILPTSRIHSSTRTQIKDLALFLRKYKLDNLIIVSHVYHLPRIKRYCFKFFPKNTNYSLVGVGNLKNYKSQVEREAEKIIEYSNKGDLPLWPV